MTRSAAATERAGARLAKHLLVGDLVELVGELGSGKTTFVRGLAGGLGAGGHVSSPTFQLVRIHPGPTRLAHLDLYRLQGDTDTAELGMHELLDEAVVVVEWADRLARRPPARGGRIEFEHVDETSRRLRIREAPDDWSF